MKKIVVLSGAGISAESGLKTFRDSNGLWENHRVEDVATPQGWAKDPDLVLEFYNQRRKQALDAKPNAGHLALKELENYYDVTVITQNVDNLHEKAGSKKVVHLHGELYKSRSTRDENLVYDIKGWELKRGDRCEKGSQLRPHIVWFGEAVPMMEDAVELTYAADILIIVGTSMAVYPAAGLIDYVRPRTPIYVVDPNVPEIRPRPNLTFIPEPATTGLSRLAEQLILNAKGGV
ncbi:SIR2 family NAD-dependent protein deacylase [Larkinella terrae]|uniref:NAD-dependent protein deacylase n=1 Tax=Larkinella terrae TaxID=2025311 RepID=A0A7K0EL99_9BACT|nr:NAD-dependent deacylase [Larkinella terrae]MRS62564.1 NAD-dependent deacylase [Larkinella terrae]